MRSSAPYPAAANSPPPSARPGVGSAGTRAASSTAVFFGVVVCGGWLLSFGLGACNSNITALDASASGGAATGGTGAGTATGGTAGGASGAAGGGGDAAAGGTGGVIPHGPEGGSGPCHVVLEEHAALPGLHVDYCSALTYDGNPPASGSHYPSWPAFKAYDAPVPWGYLLHGLEHGAIVISYNCPQGCADDLAAAKTFMASLPNKAGCQKPSVILTPEPNLEVPIAASAWNDPKAYTLKAACFDAAAFGQFYSDHVDKNYESTCEGGDWSNNGWCPPGTPPPCGPGC